VNNKKLFEKGLTMTEFDLTNNSQRELIAGYIEEIKAWEFEYHNRVESDSPEEEILEAAEMIEYYRNEIDKELGFAVNR